MAKHGSVGSISSTTHVDHPIYMPDHDIPFPLVDLIYQNRPDVMSTTCYWVYSQYRDQPHRDEGWPLPRPGGEDPADKGGGPDDVQSRLRRRVVRGPDDDEPARGRPSQPWILRRTLYRLCTSNSDCVSSKQFTDDLLEHFISLFCRPRHYICPLFRIKVSFSL